MLLSLNSVYQIEEGNQVKYERILWINRAENLLVTIEIDEDSNKLYLPKYNNLADFEQMVKDEIVIKCIHNRFDRIIDRSSAFYLDHLKRRDERWKRIQPLAEDVPDIYHPTLRSSMIKELVEKTGVSSRTYYNDLKVYWKYGQTQDALLPRYENSGGKGNRRIITEEQMKRAEEKGEAIPKRGRSTSRIVGTNVDESILANIRKSLNGFYSTTNKPSIAKAYKYYLKKYCAIDYVEIDGIPTPLIDPKGKFITYETYKYHVYKEMDLRETIRKREGDKGFNLRHRPVLGSSTNIQMSPGSVYQMDATQLNLYLVNRYTDFDDDHEVHEAKIIKKPTLYLVQDVLTRYIVSAHVRLNAPSWIGMHMALIEAFTNEEINTGFNKYDKSDSCLIPKQIVTDKGSEFISLNSDYLTNSITDINMTNASSFRADMKGIVEKMLDLIQQKITGLPGTVKKGYKERGEKDHRVEALLTIDDLNKIIQKIVNGFNNRLMKNYELDEEMTKHNVKPIPAELWKWAEKTRGNDLKEKPLKEVIVNLLPRGLATVKRDGIYFEGRSYHSPIADEEQWYEIAEARGTWQTPISYDPRNAGILYLVLENGFKYESCRLLPRHSRYNQYTLDEIAQINDLESKRNHELEIMTLQDEITEEVYIEQIVNEAKKKSSKNFDSLSDYKKVKGINDNTIIARSQENSSESKKIHDLLNGKEKRFDASVADNAREKMEVHLKEMVSKEMSLHEKLKDF